MRIVAAHNRRSQRAIGMFAYAGREDAVVVTTEDDLEDAIRAGKPMVTDALSPNRFLLSDATRMGPI